MAHQQNAHSRDASVGYVAGGECGGFTPGRYARALGGLCPVGDAVELELSAAPEWVTRQRPASSENAADRVAAVQILLIDDSTLQRENLAAVLGEETSIPAVGWDVPSVIEALTATPPRVVLLSMMTRDSIGLLRLVRKTCPSARIIVIGIAQDDHDAIIACAEAGIAGYHIRTDSLDHLITLIARVDDGESSCPTEISTILMNHLSALAAEKHPDTKDLILTAREMQILRMLEMGRSNRDIADELCITLHTVKNHVHSVLTKLGASTRTEAAAMARALH